MSAARICRITRVNTAVSSIDYVCVSVEKAPSKKRPVQNELIFRQMVDGISALVAVLTPDGAVDFVNRQVLDYFGKTLEELKDWSNTDAVHPDDLPVNKRAID